MSFTVVDAARLLDEKILTDKEIEFLLRAREGLELSEVKDETAYKNLKALNLVQGMAFTHPRATKSIPGVVISEAGNTVTNEIDKRFRENSETPVEPYANADESVKKTVTREPVDREIPKTIESKEDKKQAIAKKK